MSEESEAPRGVDAWQAQRAEVAKRNLAARKRGQAERRSRDRAVEVRARAEEVRERHELEELNSAIAKRRGEGRAP